ncbi:hypothetical protein EDB19DRAFT_1829540 [Suillus lakei]|nr:hypothetical protein EDB19DRAFT_1829540 [Suillus lakei]
MCMGTENIKVAVPWGDLIKNQSDFVEGTYWPVDVKKKKLHPTFCFKAWKDTDGDMEVLAKAYQKVIWHDTEDNESSDNEAVISDHSREPPAKSHQKVTRRASHCSKVNAVLGEESLDEQEDHQSLSREQTPLALVEISSTMTDGPGVILFLMEASGPMWGICRVDEWANGHQYSIDGWAEVVGYYVDGCTKVDVYQINGYAKGTCYHIHGWAQMYIILDGWAKGVI